MLSFDLLLALAALGLLAGFLNSAIGFGGGFTLVPGLLLILGAMRTAGGHEMHVALGTTMVVTTWMAARNAVRQWPLHKNELDRALFRRLMPLSAMGAVVGVGIATVSPASALKIGLACFALYVGVRWLMFPDTLRGVPGKSLADAHPGVAGFGFGALVGGLGLGGSTLYIPYLSRLNVAFPVARMVTWMLQVPTAAATALTFVIAGFIFAPELRAANGFFGFVFWPAVVVFIAASGLGGELGEQLRARSTPLFQRQFFAAASGYTGLHLLAHTAGIPLMVPAMVFAAVLTALIGAEVLRQRERKQIEQPAAE